MGREGTKKGECKRVEGEMRENSEEKNQKSKRTTGRKQQCVRVGEGDER